MLDQNEEPEREEDSEEWKQIQQLFLNRDEQVLRSFASYLRSGNKRRLTNLRNTIVFLNDKSDAVNKFGIYVIVRCILQLTIHSYELSDDDIVDLLNFINTEARHFGTPALIKTIDYCLGFMKKENDTDLPVRWIEIFGKLVAVLAIRGEFQYEKETLDGQEFKGHVITSICGLPWGQNNGASLIAALREIPGLNTTEVENILDKAGSSMNNLEPSAIPPIAYQLLILAGSSHASRLVYYFDKYFAGVYNEEDAEEALTIKKKKAFGTTVFHFIQSAKTVEPLQKELLRRVKASQYDHGLVMQPFMLSVALGLTSIEYIKETILDGLRNTILKRISETQLNQETAFYFSLFDPVLDTIVNHFKIVVEAKSSELDFMLDGLKDLAVGLVNSDQLVGQTQQSKEECQKLGNYLLCSIVQRHTHYLPTLMNEFLKNQSSIANIECLAKCLSKVNATVIRKQYSNRLHELIHYLPLMTVETATPILKALLPAFQLSSELLGELLMILRKTIWKSIEARRVSVTAMILLLSNSTIVGSIPKSQFCMTQDWTSSQGPSQLSFPRTDVLGTSTKNESICFEVLTILKRFLTLQVDVREHVYLGVRTIIQKNPELIYIICSHLQTHIRQHMSSDVKSLVLKNVLTVTTSGDIVINDDLGLLIQSLATVTLRAQIIYELQDDEPDNRPKSVLQCEKFVLTWYLHALETKLEDFEIQTSEVLSANGGAKPLELARQVRNHYIVQFLQVIEALIEFICMGGSQRAFGVLFNDGTARDMKIKGLFKKFLELEPALIVKSKPTKRDAKGTKKAAADKTATTAATSTCSTDPPSGTTNGNSTKAKIKLEPVKKIVFSHIMAAENINKILADLYHPEETPDDPLTEVKHMIDFDRFILDAIKQKVTSLKNKELLKERVPTFLYIIGQLTKSSYFLWNKELVNAKENYDTLQETGSQAHEAEVLLLPSLDLGELRIELISDILELAYQRTPLLRLKILSEFLQESNKSYDELFEMFFEQWSNYFQYQVFVVSTAGIQAKSKMVYFMFRILSTLLKGINVESREILTKLISWFEAFLKKKSYIEPTCGLMESVIQPYITICCKHQKHPKLLVPLAKRVHYILGDIDEEEVTPEKRYWLITTETSPVLIHQYGLYVERMLDLVKGIVNRLSLPSSYNEEEMLAGLRKRCCRMMHFILEVLTELIRSKFPAGPCVNVLQKAVVQFFNVMASITENLVHFYIKSHSSFDCPQFEALVKQIGTDFKMRVEMLITHLETIRREDGTGGSNTTTTSKKKKATDKQNVSKYKFMKDTKTFPVLVYSIEKYEQQLILLCRKTKENFLEGTKQSTARDFRIMMEKLQGFEGNAAQDANSTRNTNVAPSQPSTSRRKHTKQMETDKAKNSKSSKEVNTKKAASAANPQPGPSKSKPDGAPTSKSAGAAPKSKIPRNIAKSKPVAPTDPVNRAKSQTSSHSPVMNRTKRNRLGNGRKDMISASDFATGSGFFLESTDDDAEKTAREPAKNKKRNIPDVSVEDEDTNDVNEINPTPNKSDRGTSSAKTTEDENDVRKTASSVPRRFDFTDSRLFVDSSSDTEDENVGCETGNHSVIMATTDTEEEVELTSVGRKSRKQKRPVPLSPSPGDSSSEDEPLLPKRKHTDDGLNKKHDNTASRQESRAVVPHAASSRSLLDSSSSRQKSVDTSFNDTTTSPAASSTGTNGDHSTGKPKTAMRRLGLGGLKRKQALPPG